MSAAHNDAWEDGWHGGRNGRVRGTTPRQLQNSPSFIVESHDSESPYIPRLLPFATLATPPRSCLCLRLSRARALSAFLPAATPSPATPFFRSLLLRLSYLFLYRRSFLRGAKASTLPAGISTVVTSYAYYAYTSALDGTERGD